MKKGRHQLVIWKLTGFYLKCQPQGFPRHQWHHQISPQNSEFRTHTLELCFMLLNVEKTKRRKRQASGARRKRKKEVLIADLPTVVAFCMLQNIMGLQTNIYSRVFQPSMTYSSPDQRPQANLKQCSLKVKPKILSIHQMFQQDLHCTSHQNSVNWEQDFW